MYNNWGCAAEECLKTLMARRDNKVVCEGKSLLLWCDVQHCGTKSWTGGWGIVKEDTFTLLRASSRFHIYNEDLSSNSTRLNINFITTNKSDSGTYQCRINWGQTSNNGHVTYVNVTDVLSDLRVQKPHQGKQSERTVLMRAVLFICAFLCFPIALALARQLSHPTSPPVPPRSNSATRRRERPHELVYASLALESEGHPNHRPPLQTHGHNVYSSLRL